jgi:peptidoglycan/xylan/chitin deacetylase (PgdA/CDA1 family)
MIFRAIPNKREFLARAFGRLGLLGLLERTFARRRPGLVVLTYHRIAEPGLNLFYDPVISATPESFRAQITWLRDRARLVTLDELINQVERGSPWREPVTLLTFDDGYRDNFDLAVPILREQQVPATFFVPSAFLESPRLPWWDHVAYAIKQTNVSRFVVECSPTAGQPPLEIDLQALPRTVAIMKIIRAFLDEAITDEHWFLDRLMERCMVKVDSECLGRELFASWAQVWELANSDGGLTIGSHSHSHSKLARLDQEAQRNELAGSRQILEAELRHSIKALAYPYGWPGTYTVETKALAEEAGYHLAFSAREGINRFTGFDRYEVKRLGVGSADSAMLLRARCTLHASFGNSFL